MNPYRRRVWALFEPLLAEIGPVNRGLDFGSGDGWFATQMRDTQRIASLTPVDVMLRKKCLVEPVIYDGVRLPFEDGHFDFSYSVDVLHHCPDPAASLCDLLRVTRQWFLLKDHTWNNLAGKYLLALLDEVGNRRFGVPCLYKHQHAWEWSEILRREGFELHAMLHPARCHIGPMAFANRFEFVALWRRASAAVSDPASRSPAG